MLSTYDNLGQAGRSWRFRVHSDIYNTAVDDKPHSKTEKETMHSFLRKENTCLPSGVCSSPSACVVDCIIWKKTSKVIGPAPPKKKRTFPNPRTTALSSPPRDNLARALGLYLRCVGPKRTLSGKALPADVAMERPVLHAFQLRVMVAEVLLQVRQLDEGAAAVRKVAFVGALTCKGGGNSG